ncbi:MAG: hypothetical protein WCF57_15190 [Pyrinomonadaceae bacterium]
MSRNLAFIHHLTAVENQESAPSASSEAKATESYAAQQSGCSLCFGTGMEVISGKGARRCRCRMQDRQKGLLEAARIPHRYSQCSLSNYQPEKGNVSQLIAFNYAYRLVREYPAIDRGLLLMGSVGVGKLHPRNYPCRTESCATQDHQGH